MADGLNKVFILGNLGQDPELRVTQGGNAVMTMSVACSETYLDRNRVRQEKTEWVRCVVWGRRAEALAKFLKKGAKVFVEGSLQTTSWDDRETGAKRYKTEVVAKNVILGGGAKARRAPNDPQDRRPSRRDHYDNNDDSQGDNDDQDYGGGGGFNGGGDDDIPFARIADDAREAWWRF